LGNVERPAVDVVIPAYNAAQWIGEAVESALGQIGVVPRVVVVDDGSSDGTLDVVGRFGPEVTVFSQANQGVSVARNAGVAHGSAPYLAFLDADDVWAPDFLVRQTGLLGSRPELDLAFTDHYQFENGGQLVLRSFLSGHRGFLKIPRSEAKGAAAFVFDRLIGDDLVDGVFVWTSALCMRRQAFEVSGGFDPALRNAQDHDLWLRLCRTGRAGVILEPLAGRRLHPSSLSNNELGWTENELRILDKIERSPELYPPAAGRLLGRRPRLYVNAGRLAEELGDVRRARRHYLKAWRLGGGVAPGALAVLTLLPGPVRAIVKGAGRRLKGAPDRRAN
jgi:glycosyltransferase involved in cell wall biosynthesis